MLAVPQQRDVGNGEGADGGRGFTAHPVWGQHLLGISV